MIKPGVLHLFPCPIAEDDLRSIPEYVKDQIRKVDFFIAERAKTARRYLKQIDHPLSFDEITIFELDKKEPLKDKDEWLNELMMGKEIGLLSEAGTPCIADPGEKIVSWAHQLKAQVRPYVGPSSILLALIGSGLNGESFMFHTYLPIQENELKKEVKDIVQDIQRKGTSHLFIETPYRNLKMFDFLTRNVPGNIHLCLATDLTSSEEDIRTKSIKDWKSKKKPDIQKKATVFILGRMQ